MKNLIITGVIGSGKTQFCKKFLQKHCIVGAPIYRAPMHYLGAINRCPYIYVSVDDIGKKIFPFYLTKKNISKTQLKKKLFFSPPAQKKRAWEDLEYFLHPIMQTEIHTIQKKYAKKKGTILWDCALAEKFFPDFYPRITIPSKKLYPHIFLLKKYREISSLEIFTFLKQQKK